MGFLKTHIRRKGANRCSGFEASPNTSRHEESRGSTTDTEHLESSVLRESRSQPILTSTPVSTDSVILEHFDQMRTLISGSETLKQERTLIDVKYYPRDQPLLPESHRRSGYCQQPLNRCLVPPRQQFQQLRLLHTQPHWLWKPSISTHITGRGQQTQLNLRILSQIPDLTTQIIEQPQQQQQQQLYTITTTAPPQQQQPP